MDKMKIYNHLPIWGQNLACFIEGKNIKKSRYGKHFFEKLEEYEKRDGWTFDHKIEYRDSKLEEMIKYCYDFVPYYFNKWNEYGIRPSSIKRIDDLKQIPILTKEEVKSHINEFVSTKCNNKDICIFPTGGTTGAGLRFHSSMKELQEQWAVWWRFRRANGIQLETRCGNFGGKQIVPLSQKTPPYWRTNKPNNQVYFSSYHISEKNVETYAECIKREKLDWLHGYASSLSELAAFLNDKSIQVPCKWVSIGSENLYKKQEEEIEKAFCVKPIQHYGLTEGVANISEMEPGMLTVDEDFACVEFLPTEVENEYRIIGTALTKYVMPLIRYDTGDVAVISEIGKHNESGRIIDRISGRSVEYVKLPSGGKVGAASISLAIHDFHFIRELQIIQPRVNHIDVNIVRNMHADDFDEKKLKSALRERFGSEMDINLHYVESLRKTKNGKHRLVISEL